MAKTFDATLNNLIGDHVADWAAFLVARARLPAGPVEVLDTDLSSTLQSDRLFRIDGPKPYVLHLEVESTGRLGIPEELLGYNVAARRASGLRVHSVLVVLRPKANATDQTGWLELEGADDSPYLTFRYTVVRVWEESIAGLLVAGPGLAPLAVLTNEAAADLDSAFERFRDRLQQPDVPRNVAEVLFGATFLLSGLRYDRDRIINLYRRLSMTLEDSTTYQWIMEQGEARGEARGLAMGEAHGRLAEARNIVSLLGSHRFGQPSAAIQEALEAITDRDRLERIAKRIIDAGGWDDLLATP